MTRKGLPGKSSAAKRNALEADAVYGYWMTAAGWSVCVYCGDFATTCDHVQPLSHIVGLMSVGADLPEPLQKVPACMECNCLAGSNVFDSFDHKAEWLRDAIARRHRDALRAPTWTMQEIEELDGITRIDIEAAMRAKEKHLSRTSWCMQIYHVEVWDL